MKSIDFDRYFEASNIIMDASEFTSILADLDLSPSRMAILLRCSEVIVKQYMTSEHTIPASVAGFIRIMLMDQKHRNAQRTRAARWYDKNPTRGRRSRAAAIKKYRSGLDIPDQERNKVYQRAYQHFRRTGDRSRLDEFYDLFGHRKPGRKKKEKNNA